MVTITEHGRTTVIEEIAVWRGVGIMCGVGRDAGSYFVYMRHADQPYTKHCGPYSTREQAVDWINGVRESS